MESVLRITVNGQTFEVQKVEFEDIEDDRIFVLASGPAGGVKMSRETMLEYVMTQAYKKADDTLRANG
jgi:hypothetical protein